MGVRKQEREMLFQLEKMRDDYLLAYAAAPHVWVCPKSWTEEATGPLEYGSPLARGRQTTAGHHVISVTDNVPAVPACRQASFWPGVTVK